MKIILTRYAYTPSETQGELIVGNERFHTIERPWIPGPHPGGMSFESCIPDGEYELRQHTRPTGDKVVALINPRLGVWYQKEDRPDVWGRYLVLLHAANYVNNVVGCIGPGMGRAIADNRYLVTSSRVAMSKIMPKLKGNNHTILIQPTDGAFDE